jgi:hypothetical protein
MSADVRPGGASADGPAPDVAPTAPDVAPAPPDVAPAPPDAAPAPPDGAPASPDAPPSLPSLSRELLAHWSFDEEGVGLARDRSGNGLHGEVKGTATGGAGRVGRALDLTRRPPGWVRVPSSPALDRITKALSIAAWVNRTSNPVDNGTVLSRQYGTSAWDHYNIAFDPTGRLRFFLNTYAGSASFVLATPDPVPLGRWVHVAAVYDGATARIYQDGVEVARKTAAVTFRTATTPVTMGGEINGPSEVIEETFTGFIDEVSLHARALLPEEVAALARGARP